MTDLHSPLELLRSDPLVFFILVAALIGALTLHEFAHAVTADYLGDRMPRAFGRLTLNPAAHLDPLGTLLIVLVGFGWAKPVEFRPQALRSRRFGSALVALAGPLMNLGLALLSALALMLAAPAESSTTYLFLRTFLALNVLLAVFNLLPLPPLDGSRLLTVFLPPNRQHIVYFLDRYGFLILLLLLFFGGPSILYPLVDRVANAFEGLAGL